jgi:hypothetical protein
LYSRHGRELPRTAAGLPNAHIEFEREKEVKLCFFDDSFMEKYPSTGISPAEMLSVAFGWHCIFIHLALFHA